MGLPSDLLKQQADQDKVKQEDEKEKDGIFNAAIDFFKNPAQALRENPVGKIPGKLKHDTPDSRIIKPLNLFPPRQSDIDFQKQLPKSRIHVQDVLNEKLFGVKLPPDFPSRYRPSQITMAKKWAFGLLGAEEAVQVELLTKMFPTLLKKEGDKAFFNKSFIGVLDALGAPKGISIPGGIALGIALSPSSWFAGGASKLNRLTNLGDAMRVIKTAPKSIFKGANTIDDVLKNVDLLPGFRKVDTIGRKLAKNKRGFTKLQKLRMKSKLRIVGKDKLMMETIGKLNKKQFRTLMIGGVPTSFPEAVEKGMASVFRIESPFRIGKIEYVPFKADQVKMAATLEIADKVKWKRKLVKSGLWGKAAGGVDDLLGYLTTKTGNPELDKLIPQFRGNLRYLREKEVIAVNNIMRERQQVIEAYRKSKGISKLNWRVKRKIRGEAVYNLQKIETLVAETKIASKTAPKRLRQLDEQLKLIMGDASTRTVKRKAGVVAEKISANNARLLKEETLQGIPVQTLDDDIDYVHHAITPDAKAFQKMYKIEIERATQVEGITEDAQKLFKYTDANIPTKGRIVYREGDTGVALSKKAKKSSIGKAPFAKQRKDIFRGLDISEVNKMYKNLGFGYEKELDALLEAGKTPKEIHDVFKNKPVVKEFFSSNSYDYTMARGLAHAKQVHKSQVVQNIVDQFGVKIELDPGNKLVHSDYALRDKLGNVIQTKTKYVKSKFKSINDIPIDQQIYIKTKGGMLAIGRKEWDTIKHKYKKGTPFFVQKYADSKFGKIYDVDDYRLLLNRNRLEPGIKDWLDRYLNTMATPEHSNALLRSLFKATQFWKKSVTLPWAKFHGRNAVSDLLNNAIAGTVDYRVYVKAGKLQAADSFLAAGGDISKLANKDKYIITTATGRNLPGLKVVDFLKKRGYFESGFWGNEFNDPDIQLGAKNFLDKALDAANNNKLFEWGGKVGRAVENNLKLGVVVDRLVKGDGLEDAMMFGWKQMHHYGDITPTEKILRKSVFPFMTWPKKNLALQFNRTMDKPFLFPRSLQKAKDGLEDAALAIFGPEGLTENEIAKIEGMQPDWWQFMPKFRVVTKKGNFHYVNLDFFFSPAAAMAMLRFPKSIQGLLNPIISTELQINRDYDFFREKPISKTIYPYRNYMGWKVRSPELYFRLKNIPFLNKMDSVLGGSILGTQTTPPIQAKIERKYRGEFVEDSMFAQMRPAEFKTGWDNLFNFFIGNTMKLDPMFSAHKFELELAREKIQASKKDNYGPEALHSYWSSRIFRIIEQQEKMINPKTGKPLHSIADIEKIREAYTKDFLDGFVKQITNNQADFIKTKEYIESDIAPTLEFLKQVRAGNNPRKKKEKKKRKSASDLLREQR